MAGYAHRFNRSIDATPRCEFHDRLHRIAVGVVDHRGRTETLRGLQPAVVQIDHDDFGGRIEAGCEQRGEPDRPAADNSHGTTRLHFPIEHTALEARRQDIAQHHERLFVGTVGNAVKTGVRMRDPDEFGLRAVDLVAENPSAAHAMGIHLLAAIFALPTRADARDQDALSRLERGHAWAYLVDDARAFMAENAPRLAGCDVALENVQVRAADRRLVDLDDGVGGGIDHRLGSFFNRFLAWANIDERFHCRSLRLLLTDIHSAVPFVKSRYGGGPRPPPYRHRASSTARCSKATGR